MEVNTIDLRKDTEIIENEAQYKEIKNKAIPLFKVIDENIKSDRLSHIVVLRIIEAIALFDPDCAMKLIDKIKATKLKIAVSLLVAEHLHSTDHHKALQICENLSKKIQSTKMDSEVVDKGIVFLIELVSRMDRTKAGQMKAQFASKLASMDPKDKELYEKISVLPHETKIKTFRKFLDTGSKYYYLNKLANAGAFGKDEELPSSKDVFLDKHKLFWKTQDGVKNPDTFLGDIKTIVEAKPLDTTTDSYPYIKACMKVWAKIFNANPDAAQKLFDEASKWAKGSPSPSACALMVKSLSKLPQFKQETVSFYQKTIEKLDQTLDPDGYDFNDDVAKKIHGHDSKKSSELLLKDLKHLSGDGTIDKLDSQALNFVNRIADGAPSSFWKDKADDILELFDKVQSEVKLLFMLKILAACEDPQVKKDLVEALHHSI